MEVCFHGRNATWCYCLSCRVELSTSTSTPAMSRVLGLRSASSRSTRHSENMWCRSRRLPSATITDHMSDPIRNLTEGEVEFFGEHGWLHVRGLAAPRFVARLAAKAAVLRGAASTPVVASETAASYKRRGRVAGSDPPRPTSGRRTAACGSSTTSTCTATWAARGSAPTTTCAIIAD